MFSADLKDNHSRQTWGKAKQDIVGDEEEPLYDDDGFIPQEVSQQEDREEKDEIGVCPDREQVVVYLWETRSTRENECRFLSFV